MDVLYRDFGAARYRSIDERMANPSAFSPAAQIFQPLSTLTSEVACRRYQATPENGLTTNWYVKLNVDSKRDKKAFDNLVVPAGETLNLYKHLPGYNRLLDVGVMVGCGSHAMATDIEIVKYADPATAVHTVAAGVDLSVCDDFACEITGDADADKGLPAGGDYIKRDDSYLLCVKITPPFTNADGDGVFVDQAGTTCETRACLHLIVHAHLRNMCFADTLTGCRLDDYGCDCETQTAPPDCDAPPVPFKAPEAPAAPVTTSSGEDTGTAEGTAPVA